MQETDPNTASSKVDTQWDKKKWQIVKPVQSWHDSPSSDDFYTGRLKSDTLVSQLIGQRHKSLSNQSQAEQNLLLLNNDYLDTVQAGQKEVSHPLAADGSTRETNNNKFLMRKLFTNLETQPS